MEPKYRGPSAQKGHGVQNLTQGQQASLLKLIAVRLTHNGDTTWRLGEHQMVIELELTREAEQIEYM